MPGSGDTIAAIATASGRGAIGIVRVTGPAAGAIAQTLTGRDLRSQPRRMSLSTARNERGEAIDSVLAVLMPGPNSFTGEDVAEFHCHGGDVAQAEILSAVLAAGARAADAGEFSRRSFENGRMDLTQAEGILAVIGAGSARALRVGQALLAGELRERIDGLREQCDRVLASCEAAIDFPEDVEGPADVAALSAVLQETRGLASTGTLGRVLAEGVSIALVGAVNAGKSSLFNRLVGRERALVAAEPGTTRDYVEAQLVWSGVPVTLVDTAGEREAPGVEARGIELGRERARECDLELVVSAVDSVEPRPTLDSSRQLLVINKSDLARPDGANEVAEAETVFTSATTGAGLDTLRATVLSRAAGTVGGEESVMLVNARQRGLIDEALVALGRAHDAAKVGRAAELVAADLQLARGALARLVGEELGDEMLDSLFAQFCIGK